MKLEKMAAPQKYLQQQGWTLKQQAATSTFAEATLASFTEG
jgi:uncharacterized membrane protein YagU involved in acid resistance